MLSLINDKEVYCASAYIKSIMEVSQTRHLAQLARRAKGAA